MNIDRLALSPGALTLALSLAFASNAGAQEPPKRDPAAAEALYLSGRELWNQGQWDEACAKFEASLSLNVAATTLINIAMCRDKQGRLTEAQVAYKQALQVNRDTPSDSRREALQKVITEGLSALEPRVPQLRIAVPNPPEGLAVTRDGLPLLAGALGEDMPLDPGEHRVVVSAPGYVEHSMLLRIAEGERRFLSIELKEVPRPAPGPLASPPPAPTAPPQNDGQSAPTWAYVAGGAGLLLIGGGVYFKIDQGSAEDNLVSHCGRELLCDPKGSYDPAADNARKNRDFALFLGMSAAGAAALGLAAYGFWGQSDEPSATAIVPVISPHSAGLTWAGAL